MIKKTVVISCVTFETAMVSTPAKEYKADEVHIFHYVSADSPSGTVYSEFYDEAVRQINAYLPSAVIVEHASSPVYDFRLMLRDLLACIDDIENRLENAEILINVSSGTSEFIAAGVISAMMSGGRATAFTVRTAEYTIAGEDAVRSAFFKDGRPVGLSTSVNSPSSLPYFEIDRPDENLVRGLRIYDEMKDDNRSMTAANVIAEMKKRGIWLYSPTDDADKTDIKQKETMYYQRHFVNAWDQLGWIERPGRKVKFNLTPAGRNYIDTFYID